MKIIVLFLFAIVILSVSGKPRRGFRSRANARKDANIRFQLLQHMPCPHNANSIWTKKIELPGKRKAPLRKAKEPGCYKFGGDMDVFQTMKRRSPMQMYIEVKDTPKSDKAPEPCHNVGKNGCGGTGSCVYCDACNVLAGDLLKEETDKKGGKNVKEINCDNFKKGRPKEMNVEFCFPTLKEFLESRQLNPNIWEDIIEEGQTLKKIGIYMKIRFYNSKINRQFKQAIIFENLLRKTSRKEEDEALPQATLNKIPFYKDLVKKQIGCHIIQGNLFLKKQRNRRSALRRR